MPSNVLNKSHTFVFITHCDKQYRKHLFGACWPPRFLTRREKSAYQTFYHTRPICYSWHEIVGLSEGLGVCFCWFHSGGEGAQGGLVGWAGAAVGAQRSQRSRACRAASPCRLLVYWITILTDLSLTSVTSTPCWMANDLNTKIGWERQTTHENL